MNTTKLNLENLQTEIQLWREYNFPKSFEEDQFLGIVEEVGELSHARLKIRQGIRGAIREDEVDAVGDLMIYLFNYCSCRGISVERAIQVTWNKVKQRNWIKFPGNGVDK